MVDDRIKSTCGLMDALNDICMEGLTTASVLDEIQTEHFLNMCLGLLLYKPNVTTDFYEQV
jgi:hypothetical protein